MIKGALVCKQREKIKWQRELLLPDSDIRLRSFVSSAFRKNIISEF